MGICGKMWQQIGEEGEAEGIEEEAEEVGVVEEAREEIVGGKEDTTAPHTTMISEDHQVGVGGLPWEGGEHQAVAQVSHNFSSFGFLWLLRKASFLCGKAIVEKSIHCRAGCRNWSKHRTIGQSTPNSWWRWWQSDSRATRKGLKGNA